MFPPTTPDRARRGNARSRTRYSPLANETASKALAIAGLSFGTAFVALGSNIANVALPTIARDLKVDNARAVLVVTTYQLAVIASMLPLSALGERIGLRRLYRIGQTVFALSSLLPLVLTSFAGLLFARVLQGLGAAACLSVSAALIRALYRPQSLGRGLGLNSVVVSSSAVLAPTLGGLILSVADWRLLFAAGLPAAALSLLLSPFLPDPQLRGNGFDLRGAAMTTATMVGLVIGLQAAAHHHQASALAWLAVTIIFAATLIAHERRVVFPVLPIDLLRLRPIAVSSLAGMVVFVAQMLILVSLPFRLEHDFGLLPRQVGLVLGAWPLTTLFVAPAAGLLADRVHPGYLGSFGMALASIAVTLVALLPADASQAQMMWRLSLCGLGFALFMMPNARLIVALAPTNRAAAAGGLVSIIRLLGQTSGTTIVSMFLVGEPGAATHPLLLGAALTLLAGLCSLDRMRTPIAGPGNAR